MMPIQREKLWRAIGLMSGTSLDGVDVALIQTDGDSIVRRGPAIERPYEAAERAILHDALDSAAGMTDRAARQGVLAQAEAVVTQAHIAAVQAFCAANTLSITDIDLIGFHGQTVWHDPSARITVQIGDASALAQALQMPVVHDFRAADVAAGGQGAPLVPVYHRALALAAGLQGASGIVNIGGVANVTLVNGAAEPIACDVGPGNALLDDFMMERTGAALDLDGATAARGQAEHALVDGWLRRPFFTRPAPKSLDRNAFTEIASTVQALSTPDGAATLTAFTAGAIAASAAVLPIQPERWIVCGGGARNPTLMAMLRARTTVPVHVADDFGWSAAAMEAEAFAYLAVRSVRGLPLSFPATTGVVLPQCGGVLVRPARGQAASSMVPTRRSR